MQSLPDPRAVISSLPSSWSGSHAGVAKLLDRAAAAARHHTGGSGFNADGSAVEADLADLLVQSVRRALVNPELSLVGEGEAFGLRPGSFADWSYEEYAVLERYREPEVPVPHRPHLDAGAVMHQHAMNLGTLQPELYQATLKMSEVAGSAAVDSGLAAPFVELIRIRVSQLNGC